MVWYAWHVGLGDVLIAVWSYNGSIREPRKRGPGTGGRRSAHTASYQARQIKCGEETKGRKNEF